MVDHGNSGGPLFDAKSGGVYGVVTLGIPSPAGSPLLNNFAILGFTVRKYLEEVYLPYYHTLLRSEVLTSPCVEKNEFITGDAKREYDAKRNYWCSQPDAPDVR